MRQLVWSDNARHDFRKIIVYIAERNPPAAAKVADRIEEVAKDLAAMPTGRRGRVSGTFEKLVPGLPYIIAYALETTSAGDEVLAVVRVIHGARDWSAGTWPEGQVAVWQIASRTTARYVSAAPACGL